MSFASSTPSSLRARTRRGRAFVAAALASGGVLGVAPRASAFEREWHLGGGLGAAVAPAYSLGPAANLYGAYGISDAFDVRLEFSTSLHDRGEWAESFYSVKAALAYKLDVIQWIPWAGVSAGVLGATTDRWPFDNVQPTAGVIVGLDYAWTRHFGVGLCFTGDYGFRESAFYGAGFLRAEYHFGW